MVFVVRCGCHLKISCKKNYKATALKKVLGLLWNGRAENLKATIVTQQDQGPFGHRRVYLTTNVDSEAWCNARLQWLCRFGTTHRSMPSAIGKRHWPMKEQILSKRQLDQSLSLPPSPKNHHRRHSRSKRLHHSVLLRRCQHKTLRTSRWIHRWSWERQERRERKGARPSETPTSKISGRPVEKARPA